MSALVFIWKWFFRILLSAKVCLTSVTDDRRLEEFDLFNLSHDTCYVKRFLQMYLTSKVIRNGIKVKNTLMKKNNNIKKNNTEIKWKGTRLLFDRVGWGKKPPLRFLKSYQIFFLNAVIIMVITQRESKLLTLLTLLEPLCYVSIY